MRRGAGMVRWIGMARAALGIALVLAGPGARAAEPVPGGYALGPGDVIAVSVLGQPDLTASYEVRPDGRISIHMIGPVEIAGRTVEAVERDLAAAIGARFQGQASVVARVERYRDIFVLGDVEAPGVYPFAPGLTALKVLALAQGYRRAADLSGGQGIRLADEARKVEQARRQIARLDGLVAALEAELAWARGAAPAQTPPPQDTLDHLQAALVAARRDVLEIAVRGAEAQQSLAREEAQSFEQRRGIVASQLRATEAVLADLAGLAERGLARREQVLERQVDADDYRADELEAAAFAARARQTAVNAGNAADTARSRYAEALIDARIEAEERRATALIDRDAGLALMREMGAVEAVAGPVTTLFAISRAVDGVQTRMPATIDTPVLPGDVLEITVRIE